VEFPEADRAQWFSIPEAREHILKSQEPLLDALCRVFHFDGK
jgi:predicted NUDIX family NTP pyrophosphohydrolase